MTVLAFLLTSIWAILLVASWFVSAFLAHHIANAKGACGACWFLWGVVLGPLALLATIGMPDFLTRREIVQLRYAIQDAAAQQREPTLAGEPIYVD
ncbi:MULTISPECIES: hypothetical protein [Achromobacter]|uniref:hypothetical protein n=1 Tax=Achromobacter TaxID=222 RepID=UPI0006C08DDF|nr:hypothetical protein [Achromobacter xylosoxidans]MCH4571915.1 hypothetical protein [Achromobacter xylosoxidans]MCH4591099.1 hypothetical protein [Achromobacter xylosoxidans]MDD7988131.1 hypothetical protein [Achromobacter xylosoxidans]NEV03824.1 hypothetical protein [Achromobacter xylosoxidans]OFO60969.1 hypothetical protein HMPREF3024_24485 [Achromobacter xylosoxidans]